MKGEDECRWQMPSSEAIFCGDRELLGFPVPFQHVRSRATHVILIVLDAEDDLARFSRFGAP